MGPLNAALPEAQTGRSLLAHEERGDRIPLLSCGGVISN